MNQGTKKAEKRDKRETRDSGLVGLAGLFGLSCCTNNHCQIEDDTLEESAAQLPLQLALHPLFTNSYAKGTLTLRGNLD